MGSVRDIFYVDKTPTIRTLIGLNKLCFHEAVFGIPIKYFAKQAYVQV